MDNIRNAKIIINKSGRSDASKSYTYRFTVPTTWIKQLGFSADDREAILELKDDTIIIRKK